MTTLEEQVRERLNAIEDPCSLAQRLPVGLADMGLVTAIEVADVDAAGRHDIHLRLRVTAPGCMYVPFMDKAIRANLAELDEVDQVSTEWDPDADWSPRDIAEPVRRRLAETRAERMGATARGAV
jgi:metal-sulfur cluster biosynthetic enzyme